MTREEVKREYKESEGDPHHKAQRKALHRQLAQGGPARGVQRPRAVVVNPTHIAVALRYDHRGVRRALPRRQGPRGGRARPQA